MKFFFLCFFFCLQLFAAPVFEYTHEFTLKKDEMARVVVSELGFEDKRYNFDFSWTLFDNTQIIIHSKYRNFPRQLVLSLKRNLNRATQTLIPDYTNASLDRARLILEFSDFSQNEAKFKVYIEDKASRLMVDFIDPQN